MITDVTAAPRAETSPGGRILRFWRWPAVTQAYALTLALVFAPLLADVTLSWFQDEYQSHGVFIPFISLGLLWLQRHEIAAARRDPSAWGLLWLGLGLFLQAGCWLLRVQTQCFGVWALVLSLSGSVLILHGVGLWRVVRFPALFLLVAGGIPGKLTFALGAGLQRVSSAGAALLMDGLGFPLIRSGNVLEVVGCQLEVADACSGLKKLVALFAFSLAYGYLFQVPAWKRWALAAATLPIAVFANVLRVGALVAAAHFGGQRALDAVHDGAEMAALALAFVLFVGFGKVLGCKTLKFSL